MDYAIVELERQRTLANALIKRYEKAARQTVYPEWAADAAAMLLLYQTAAEALTSEIELANRKANGLYCDRTLEDAVREWKAEGDEWQKEHDAIKARMGARIANYRGAEAAKLKDNPPLKVWPGTSLSLGESILQAYWAGELTADSPQQAVRQGVKDYVLKSKEGQLTQPNAESIEAMLRRDDKFRDPRPLNRSTV